MEEFLKEALTKMLNGLSVSVLMRVSIPEKTVKRPDGIDVVLREGRENYGFFIAAASAKDTFETYRSWFDILREAKLQEVGGFAAAAPEYDIVKDGFSMMEDYLNEHKLAPIESINERYLFPLLEIGLKPSQIAQILELEPLKRNVSLNLKEFHDFVKGVSQKILFPIRTYNAELFRLLLIFFSADFTDVEQVCDYLEYREEYVDEVNRPEADRLHLKEIFQDWFAKLEKEYTRYARNVKGCHSHTPISGYPNALEILNAFINNEDAKKFGAILFDKKHVDTPKISFGDFEEYKGLVLLELERNQVDDSQESYIANCYDSGCSVEETARGFIDLFGNDE